MKHIQKIHTHTKHTQLMKNTNNNSNNNIATKKNTLRQRTPGIPGGLRGSQGDPRVMLCSKSGMNGHPRKPFDTQTCPVDSPMTSPHF